MIDTYRTTSLDNILKYLGHMTSLLHCLDNIWWYPVKSDTVLEIF